MGLKGLVIKDLMCMRKQLVIFGYVVLSVLVISVMFVLSAKYGNIAVGNAQMLQDNSATEIDVNNLSIVAIIAFMLLPIAVVGDFSMIFMEDNKAGFAKVSASLPLTIHQRVLAKYITALLLFGIGVVIDLVIAFVLSRLTDVINLGDFVGIIISSASIMGIYGAFVIVFCFLFHAGSEKYASLCGVLCLGGFVVLFNFSKVWGLFQDIATGGLGDRIDGGGSVAFGEFGGYIEFFMDKAFLLFLTAIISLTLSYFLSVAIAKRKGGVV